MKQKKFKKIRMPFFAEDARQFIAKRFANVAVFAVFLLAAFFLGKAFFHRSDYFRIRSVETKSASLDQGAASSINGRILSMYGGRNIFAIDLRYISRSLEEAYPDASQVAVRIALPDKIAISLKFRRPAALVRADRLYAVDDEAFVLPSVSAESLKGLPVIEGASIKYDEKRGKKSSSKNLMVALELLKCMKAAKFLAGYGADTIDASDAANLSFFLRNGTEVKIGCENFKERLKLLDHTLRDPRLVLDRVKYIDLRFKDAVVGPK